MKELLQQNKATTCSPLLRYFGMCRTLVQAVAKIEGATEHNTAFEAAEEAFSAASQQINAVVDVLNDMCVLVALN